MIPATPNLNGIPAHLVEKILKELEFPDIFRLRRVSTRLKNIINGCKPDLHLRQVRIDITDSSISVEIEAYQSLEREAKLEKEGEDDDDDNGSEENFGDDTCSVYYDAEEQGFTKNGKVCPGNFIEEFATDFAYLLSFKKSRSLFSFSISKEEEATNYQPVTNRVVGIINAAQPNLQTKYLIIHGWQSDEIIKICNAFGPGPLEELHLDGYQPEQQLNIGEFRLSPHWRSVLGMNTTNFLINGAEDWMFNLKYANLKIDQMTIEQLKIFLKGFIESEPTTEIRTCDIVCNTSFGPDEFREEFGNGVENLGDYLWVSKSGAGNAVVVHHSYFSPLYEDSDDRQELTFETAGRDRLNAEYILTEIFSIEDYD